MMCLLPVLSYAEVHYRFKFFFNWLHRAQPEIIADVPQRVQAGKPVPLLVVIKDAHRYPITLTRISALIDQKNVFQQEFNRSFDRLYQDVIVRIPPEYFTPGEHRINVKIEYRIGDRVVVCYNDNYRTTSHAPLVVRITEQNYPRFENCFFGDLHVHTNYTTDQIEFGASLKATVQMAQALELDFIAVTDHSYDLDDDPNDYLSNDPDLPKWRRFQAEVAEVNQNENEFCVLPGEEVSVRNEQGRNIHLLIFNHDRFIPGSGDSGERWLRFYSEHSLNEALAQLDDRAAAFGAHPAARTPLLQKWFIHRGDWTNADMRAPGLHGLQFLNGADRAEERRGLLLWKNLLLAGKKLFILAGNDAHGNFSRTRQIGVPFVNIAENQQHLLGAWRTGLFLSPGKLTQQRLIAGLKSGNYFVTNGPAVRIAAKTAGRKFVMGSNCPLPEELTVEALSSPEFGALTKITVLAGIAGQKEERIVFSAEPGTFTFSQKIVVPGGEPILYFRAQAESRNDRAYTGYTNPIWIETEHKAD